MNEISIINPKELKKFINKNDYVFVNFAYSNALKISYFYDEIKKKERDKLRALFEKITDIKIRVDDTLGKLHIVLLKLIIDGKKDNIVVSNIGFHIKSFDFLIDNLKKIFENLEGVINKKIIIIECNLNDSEDAESIEHYFNA